MHQAIPAAFPPNTAAELPTDEAREVTDDVSPRTRQKLRLSFSTTAERCIDSSITGPVYTNSPNTTLTLSSKQRSLHHQGLTFYRVIYQVHTPVALREDPPVRLRAVSDRKDVQGSLEASQEHTGQSSNRAAENQSPPSIWDQHAVNSPEAVALAQRDIRAARAQSAGMDLMTSVARSLSVSTWTRVLGNIPRNLKACFQEFIVLSMKRNSRNEGIHVPQIRKTGGGIQQILISFLNTYTVAYEVSDVVMLQKSPTRECCSEGIAARILPGARKAEKAQNEFTQCRKVAALPDTAAAITTGLPKSFQQTFWRMLCWTGHENHTVEYIIKGRTEKPSSLLAYLRSSGLLLTGAGSDDLRKQPAPSKNISKQTAMEKAESRALQHSHLMSDTAPDTASFGFLKQGALLLCSGLRGHKS
ncbi:hypothetical protein Anapl_15843 [Anas platyrhynchos]|uniref:Uncharacterized protein n=1 Tax=Anas platyrhynchos TaxID=8839 RepID=R0LAZ1_ANAPL|nr:hypothetical protein Anapl_15843 [Anas platyrhynchos]